MERKSLKGIKSIWAFALMLSASMVVYGQTAEYKRSALIRELKYNVKDGKYSSVLNNVQKAMEQYPESTQNDAELYYYNTIAYNNLALAEARNMYLQSSTDTAKYFNYVYSMFVNGLKCDSLGNVPNKKGRVDNKYNKEMQSLFDKNITTINSATKYFFQKKDYKKAYDFADLFITQSDSADNDVKTASTVAVLSAYSLEDYAKAVKYSELSLYESNLHEEILEVVCHCYEQLHDTALYEARLIDGVKQYTANKYFYGSLISLYNAQNEFRKSLEVINFILKVRPEDRDLWYIKGTEELYLNERDSALTSFSKAVQYKVDDAESYANIGNIYLYKSNELYRMEGEAKGSELRSIKAELHMTYNNAKNALESARKYAPEQPDLWLSGLKEIYYKLNMGKELMILERTYK